MGNRATSRQFTIAIDGPAAAGKSTVGEIVARRLDAVYFDTGLLYRALTRAALDAGVACDDGPALAALAERAHIRVERPTVADGRQADVIVGDIDVTARLRTADVDHDVSQVSAHPEVRAALLDVQRRIGRSGRVVMVGRDIGTVVLPDAELKVFLDASPEERARRRVEQQHASGNDSAYAEVLAEMIRRDELDSHRAASPLRPADDAVIIDSDPLGVDEVAERIVSEAQRRLEMAAR